MSDHICDRCGKEFNDEVNTYNTYFPYLFSDILRTEDIGEYEPTRVIMVQGDFYRITSPFLTIKEQLYLCTDCKYDLEFLLKGFFNND